jgi:hypothetical protein
MSWLRWSVAARGLRCRTIQRWCCRAGLGPRRVGSRIRSRCIGRWCGRLRGALSAPITTAIALRRWRGRRDDPFSLSILLDGRRYDWRCGALIPGAASRGSRRVAADRIHGLLSVRIRLAVRLGGGTVVRTWAATTTRGTSTFVHAAVLTKGGVLRLLARRGQLQPAEIRGRCSSLNAARHRAMRIAETALNPDGFAVR